MNRIEKTFLPVTALTHPGMSGKNNEDRFGVASFSQGPDGPRPILLAVLSDGIGGHRAGEVASEMAVNLISSAIAASDGLNPTALLQQAVQSASNTIQAQAAQISEQAGMGATCVCAWVIGGRLYTASVGDSRIYLLRGGAAHQLTIDHTWIQDAIDQGQLTPEEAVGHPNSHVIRRYLGSPTPPEVDFRMKLTGFETDEQAAANQGTRLLPDDRILLCSDGLTDLVSDQEIQDAYEKLPQDKATQALVDLANQRGGHDNITLVIIQIPNSFRPRELRPTHPGRVWRYAAYGCLGVLIVSLLLAGIAGGIWWVVRGRSVLTSTPTAALPTSATPRSTPIQPQSTSAEYTPSPALVTGTPAFPFPSENGGPTLTPWPTNTPPP